MQSYIYISYTYITRVRVICATFYLLKINLQLNHNKNKLIYTLYNVTFCK